MGRKYDNAVNDALKIAGGGVVGAGVALLFATQTGRETRKDISRFGRKVGDRTVKAVHDLADTVGKTTSELLHSGQELTGEVTRRAKRGLTTTWKSAEKGLRKTRNKIGRFIG